MKVGDYVRTKGCITKIDSCTCWKAKNQWYISYKLPDGSEWASAVTDEFKISPNIIDLIEVGDYVNGELIVDIGININNEKVIFYIIPSDYCEDWFKEENIKSIVTKEQFEAIKYEIK